MYELAIDINEYVDDYDYRESFEDDLDLINDLEALLEEVED